MATPKYRLVRVRVADTGLGPCVGISRATHYKVETACPFEGRFKFEGKIYCHRHHPIRMAETLAHRMNKMIDALRSEGFSVTYRRSNGQRE